MVGGPRWPAACGRDGTRARPAHTAPIRSPYDPCRGRATALRAPFLPQPRVARPCAALALRGRKLAARNLLCTPRPSRPVRPPSAHPSPSVAPMGPQTPAAPLPPPLFSVGVVADAQFADMADTHVEGRTQRFREVPAKLEAAVAEFAGLAGAGKLAAVLTLGDITNGNREDASKNPSDLETMAAILDRLVGGMGGAGGRWKKGWASAFTWWLPDFPTVRCPTFPHTFHAAPPTPAPHPARAPRAGQPLPGQPQTRRDGTIEDAWGLLLCPFGSGVAPGRPRHDGDERALRGGRVQRARAGVGGFFGRPPAERG